MYKEASDPKINKTEISIVQLLTIVVTVLITFVLPAQLVTLSRGLNTQAPYTPSALEQREQTTDQAGRVAGASTENKQKSLIQIPFTTYEIDLNSETGLLIIGGLILLGISIILAIYLLLT